MMSIVEILTGYYQYSDGGWKRRAGLNYKRKILRMTRRMLPQISDMEPFNIETEENLIETQRVLIRKRARTLEIRKRTQEKIDQEFEKIWFLASTRPEERERKFVTSKLNNSGYFYYLHDCVRRGKFRPVYRYIHCVAQDPSEVYELCSEFCVSYPEYYDCPENDQWNIDHKRCIEECNNHYENVDNQMENNDAHGDGTVDLAKSGNVLVSSARGSSGETQQSVIPNHAYACEDVSDGYSTMTDRWLLMARFSWDTSATVDQLMKKYDLPRDVIDNSGETINVAPFKYNMYWQGDMEVKIQVNSNKFQVGQLQASWYYGAVQDESYENRSNIWLLSQTMHGIIDAGGSNEITLYIPYKHHSPMVRTKSATTFPNYGYLGTLMIRVLSKLSTGTGGITFADVAVWIRFVNSQFGGTIERSVVPQMEGALAVAAAESLLKMSGISNCDNPPNFQPPNYVVPASVHAMSVGTGISEPMFPLRLDARGQSNGTFCPMLNEHSTLYDIMRVFGLFTYYSWRTADVAGTVIASYSARPCLSFDKYRMVQPATDGFFESRALPPVAVINNCFAQWRGSLEYRFDIISGQFHTGRLLVAYIPACEAMGSISIEKARSSLHAVFDIHEKRSFTFVVPYVHTDVWCRNMRRMGISDVNNGGIGQIFLFVLNRLVANDTVPSTVAINVYVRAGESFEVSVPIQPCLGLDYTRKIIDTDGTDVPVDNASSDGVYLGRWNDFPENIVLRWGTLGGRIANFGGAKKLFDEKKRNLYFENLDKSLVYINNAGAEKMAQYFTICHRADTWVAFLQTDAKKAAEDWNKEMDGQTWHIDAFTKEPKDNWSEEKNLILHGRESKKLKLDISSMEELELSDGQMERGNPSVVLDATTGLASTGFGKNQFGESFNGIKDVCRRYQYYGRYMVTPKDVQFANGVLFQFLAMPGGVKVNSAQVVDFVHNKCRDGIIPILLNGFKFYRGSIRFKIILPAMEGVSYWVQHRPEITREDCSVRAPTADDNELDMLAHGYGSHITVGMVNGVLEFEIPFYQPGIFGMIAKRYGTKDACSTYMNNGLVAIGVSASIKLTALVGTTFTIYYSVGDDFEFNTFQGFPAMIDATTIAEDYPPAENQMFDGLVNRAKRAVGATVAQTIDNSELARTLSATLENGLEMFKEFFDNGISKRTYAEFAVFISSQIAHLINNYNAKTIAIVVISIFTYIGVRVKEVQENIYELLSKIISAYLPFGEVLGGGKYVNADGQANLDDDELTFTAYISAIFTAICLYFKIEDVKKLDVGYIASLRKLFTVDLSGVFRSGNSLYIFIRNHFIVLKSLLRKILSRLFPQKDTLDLFARQDSIGFKFMRDAVLLADRSTIENFHEDPIFVEKVTSCEVIGRNIIHGMLRTKEDIESKLFVEVEKHLNKVSAIANELKKMGIYPSIRKRPFHIYLVGDAGVGKTVISQSLARAYCENINAARPIKPNFIVKVDAGTRHWNACDGTQPVAIFDDLWGVQNGPIFDEMLVHYLALHSNVPFMPPMAKIEDKKMTFAPELVVSTSNYAFPALNGVDRDAINRRRNLLIHVERAPLRPDLYPECAHCRGMEMVYVKSSDLIDNHHLQFAVYPNVTDERTVAGLSRISYMQLRELMLEHAARFYDKEEEMYQNNIKYFEEQGTLLDGATFEERMLSEKRIYGNYFERLIDSEISWQSFSDGVREKLMNGIESYFDKLYNIESECFGQMAGENVTEGAASASVSPENFARDSEEIIANKNRFKIRFDALRVHPKELLEFHRITNNKLLDALEVYLDDLLKMETRTPPRVSLNSFYKHLRQTEFCLHTSQRFIEATYCNGFFYNEVHNIVGLDETHCCVRGCVMNSIFMSMVMNEWVNYSAIRRIYTRKGVDLKVPLLVRDNADVKIGVFNLISAELSVLRTKFTNLVANNCIISGIYKFIKKISKELFSMFKNWCTYLIPFVCAYGATRYVASCSYVSNNEINADSQAHNYDSRVLRAPKPVAPAIASHQSASQQAHHVETLYRKNCVWITIEYLTDGKICTKRLRCVMLGGKKMLFLRHYYDFCESLYTEKRDPHFYFSYVDQSRITGKGRIEIKLLDLEKIEFHYDELNDSNLIIIVLPGTIPPAKDMTKFFASVSDHTYVGRNAWFIDCENPTRRVEIDNTGVQRGFSISSGSVSHAKVKMRDSYVYDYEKPGACGAFLLAPGLERPIIGVHVAGVSGKFGIAEPLVAEAFDVKFEKRKIVDIETIELNPPQYADVSLSNTLFPLGTVGPSYSHAQAIGSQYTESLVHGVFPVNTEPVPLDPNDPRLGGKKPLEVGASKHGLLSEPFFHSVVLAAKEDLAEKILLNAEPVMNVVGVLDVRTAIIGDPKIEELTPLNWSSSEGFPLVKERPKNVRSKKWLFELVETDGELQLNGIHPRLKQVLEYEDNLRQNGIAVQTIFTDVCKDETISIEKARAGKVRVFSTAPVQYVIAFRRYFGDFMAAYRRSGLKCEHGIGIDVNSAQWTLVANYLQKFGTKIVAGDYSHFGYTLNAQFVDAAFDIMLSWYDKYSKSPTLETDQRVRNCLRAEVLNVTRLATNYVYQAACGIPSGFPATDVVNSMVNCMYIRAAWYETTKLGFYEFDQNVALLVYGDDLAMNVSDKYIERFNTEVLNKYFAKYGIKFTDIDKSENIIPYRLLDDVTFLKCHFKMHPTRKFLYMAALDKNSVESCANWIHMRDDKYEATMDNIKQCCELAHGHGKQYYDEVVGKLKEACAEKMRARFTYLTWNELDERRYGGGEL